MPIAEVLPSLDALWAFQTGRAPTSSCTICGCVLAVSGDLEGDVRVECQEGCTFVHIDMSRGQLEWRIGGAEGSWSFKAAW